VSGGERVVSGDERVVVAQAAQSGRGAIGLVGIDLDGRLLQLSNQHIQQLRAGVHRLGYHRCGRKGAPAAATGASTPEGTSNSIGNAIGGPALLEKRGPSREAHAALNRGSNRGADRRTDRRTDRGDES
jgi:hypothetical protein